MITIPLSPQKKYTIAEVYRNPREPTGSRISWYGTIVKIKHAPLPLSILLVTEGQLWYVKVFDIRKIDTELIRKGNEILVEGKYLGMEGILHRGSSLDIPLIYCSRISGKW